ncbi:MAG: type II toxin-antitoxin system VapC family toxin [Desulfobacterales bacterium]|nr:type II toxin-antitoxin system VapC family toxin [Desulfobacterales bacterium]
MKPKIYIETSVISYLTARMSRDIITSAHQQITHDWWDNRRIKFQLYASQLVISEAEKGDKNAAEKRLNVLKDITLLELNKETVELADIFIKHKNISKKVSEDIFHIAIATIYGLDYLLTWNCKHIANAEIHKKIAKICINEGYEMPTICTPEELMGE